MTPHQDPPSDAEVSLAELQTITTGATSDPLRLHQPVWMTHFRLHLRRATHYQAGRVFLAGDAAHVHSPAGAQGMNTGIQDAINLAWKLALACQGAATAELLDTYELERAPVGRRVLRLTDRAFTAATEFHLPLCGPSTNWQATTTAGPWREAGLVAVHHLTRETAPGALHDPDGTALRRLGLDPAGQHAAHPPD